MKTLKEISGFWVDGKDITDDLKKNAQEWVKKLDKDMRKDWGSIPATDEYFVGQIDWIKRFFNLEDKNDN